MEYTSPHPEGGSMAARLNAFLKRKRDETLQRWKDLPTETRERVRKERLQAWILPNCMHSRDGMPGDFSNTADSQNLET